MKSLKGKTALLLGYGTLAKGVAPELLQKGIGTILITNRSLAKAEENAAQLRKTVAELGIKVCIIALALDVAPDAEQSEPVVTIDDFLQNLKQEDIDNIDLLLLASGGNRGDANFGMKKEPRQALPTEEVPVEERAAIAAEWSEWNPDAMRKIYEGNCLGPMELLNKLGERLTLQKAAPTIIVVGSVSPLLSGVNHYAAAKLALMEEVKRYRVYLSNKRLRCGFEAPTVCPVIWGFTESEQSRAFLYNEDGTPTYRCKQILEATATGRMGTPEEFGRTVVFVCENSYASTVVADGGFLDALVV